MRLQAGQRNQMNWVSPSPTQGWLSGLRTNEVTQSPVLVDFMFCCCRPEILSKRWKRGPAFSSGSGPASSTAILLA